MQIQAQWGASGFFLMNSNAKRKLKKSLFHSPQLQKLSAGVGAEAGGQGGTSLLSAWQPGLYFWWNILIC